MQRVAWDLRGPAPLAPPVAPAGFAGRGAGGGVRGGAEGSGGGGEEEAAATGFGFRPMGPLVVPGKYTVTMAKRVDGVLTPLPGSQSFEVIPEGVSTRDDRVAMADFQEKLARLQRATNAAEQSATEARTRLDAIVRAIDATPALPPKLREEARNLEKRLGDITRPCAAIPLCARETKPLRYPSPSAYYPPPSLCA